MQRRGVAGEVSVPCLSRASHDSRYDATAPRLELADLQAFVAAEARAVGLRCTVLETVAYGLTSCLFELKRE